MLNNRKCFLFFTILILLMSGMAVVSATDNSDSNTTIADTDTVMSTDTVASDDINIQSDNKETFSYEDGKDDTAGNSKSVTKQDITNRDTKTLSVSKDVRNYTALVEAVNEVVSNDNRTTDFTINLLEGDYNATTTMEMQINPDAMYFKTLTIEGNGIELDGLYTYQFMKLNFGYILKLKDISFTGFCSDRGGVISNFGNVSISGCSFTNNFAFEYGGVIYNEEYYIGGGNVEVTNSNFNNNFINNTAGAIFSMDGNVMVSDSTFIDNTALYAGAIFNNKGSNLTLTNSVFKNNKAVNAGGAIYDQGIGVITDCHFENNNASSKGGALFVQNNTNESVIHSTFISNFAEYGGSISVENAHVFISDSRFENDIRNEFGSGLLNEGGNVVVTGTNFTTIGYNSNQTIIFPNGTFPNSTILFIQNSVYGDGNTVDNYGGAISNFAGNLSVTGSNFNKCEALMYGGAIINYQEGNLSVIGTTFEDNSAEYGGAIFNYYGIVDVTDSEFKRNYADNGASIFNEGGSLTVSLSNFTNNSARKSSAIYSQNDGTVTVTGSNFTSNTASNGSAIYNRESNLIISDSRFVENNAYNGSGVVYNDRGTFKLKNSYFKGNTPENFRIQNSKINLIENENYIDVNTVSICLDDDNTPVYTGSLNGYTVSKGHTIRVIVNGTDLNAFSNNEFDLGFIDYDSAVDSYDALVQAVEMARTSMQDSYKISLLPGDYNATTNMVWYKVNATRSELIIDGNGLVLDGKNSIQFMEVKSQNDLILNNITLTNYRSINGGVLSMASANVTINSSYFISNNATTRGGVIYSSGYYGNLTIFNSYFINNSAYYAGAIYNVNDLLLIEDSYFINNYCHNNKLYDVNGGAICNQDYNKAYIKNSTFINNSAYNGGAVYSKRAYKYNIRTEITGSTFINNTASNSGGSIFANTFDVIENNMFLGNTPYDFVKGDDNTLLLFSTYDDINKENETVDIYVDDYQIRKNITNGVVDNFVLPMGSYNLTIVVVSTEEYGTTIRNNTFVLGAIVNDLTLSVDDVTCEYSENVPVTVSTTPKVINADVSISIGGDVVATAVVDNVTDTIVVDVDTTGYSSGIYTLNVLYTDAITGYTTSTTSQLTIVSTKTSITFNPVYDVKYNTNVTISGLLQNSEGNVLSNQIVELRLPTKTVNVLTDNRGMFNYTTVFKNTGDQTVTAIFAGTETFKASNASITFTVNKQDTQITIDEIPSLKYNDNVTITGKFENENGQPLANSQVKITLNGNNKTVLTDSEGIFTSEHRATTVGDNVVVVSYPGNAKYNACQSNITFSVDKKDTIITVNDVADVRYQEDVTISGTLENADGDKLRNTNVQVSVNGVKYTSKTDDEGVFALVYRAVSVGDNVVVVSYLGNARYIACEDSTSFVVDKQYTVITVDNVADCRYQDSVVISGVLENAVGSVLRNTNVQVSVNGVKYTSKTDDEGVFALVYRAVSVGDNVVVVSYLGNARYIACEDSTSFVVDKQYTVITVDNVADCRYQDSVVISGVLENALGSVLKNTNVQIFINGVKYSNKTDNEGVFTFNYRAVSVGDNVVVVSYLGNARYIACEDSTSFVVDKQYTVITVDNVADCRYQDSVVISGVLENALGAKLKNTNVQIFINGVKYSNKTDNEGVFTFNYKASTIGINNVTVSYPGNAKYNGCEENITFNVDKKDTVITINPISDVKKGNQVTVEGTLTNTDENPLKNTNVVVYVNGAHHTVKTDTSGYYNYTFTANSVGINEIMVKYIGNAKYNASNSTTTFNVIKT